MRDRQQSGNGLIVEHAVTIGVPREGVYAYWRDFTHLPAIMPNLESVTVHDSDATRSHWVTRAPLGRRVEWNARIAAEWSGELIAWESLPGALVPNRSQVHFADAPGGRGTEVIVRLTYRPPLGTAGAALARVFAREPHQQIGGDLRRLRAILETGEAPTTKGQPHGTLVIGKEREATLAQASSGR